MAGEIEEPFRLNFQADSLHSGSISFGRFENEALCWERRSSFSHNKYLEEVEKCSKPGLVFEKKAYFEAQFRKKGILGILCQSSPDSQNEKEYQKSEHDLNENHSAHFDIIENEVTQFEKEVFERSISERQIEFKYDSYGNDSVVENVKVDESQADRTGDVVSSNSTPLIEMKENLDGESANSNISAYTKHEDVENSCGSSKEKVLLEAEMTKPGLKPRLGVAKTKRYVSSAESKGSKKKPGEKVNDVIQRSKNDTRKAGAAIHNKVQMQNTFKHETGSRTKDTAEIRSSSKESKESGSRTVVNPQSCTTQQKPSSRTRQTSIRPKPAISETMPVKKHGSSRPGLKTGEKSRKNVTQVHQLHAKAQPMNGAIKQLSKSLNFKATPMPSFYSRPSCDTDSNKGMVTGVKQRKPLTSSIRTGAKVSNKAELCAGEERGRAISIPETRKTDIDSQQQASGTMSCHSTVTSDSTPSSPVAQSTNNSLVFESNRFVGVKKEQVEKPIILCKNKVLEGNQINKMKTMQRKQKPRSGISSGTNSKCLQVVQPVQCTLDTNS